MEVNYEFLFMASFITFVIAVLVLDLVVIGRKSHEVSLREASIWSVVWIIMALLFAVFLRYHGEKVHGIQNFEDLKNVVDKFAPALKLTGVDFETNLEIFRKNMTIDYLTGYVIEETLSVDNLFVMLMVLTAFSVKKSSYKPVLFWGILGAIILRFVFIFAGSALIQKFEWILLVFGAYLIYAGIDMFLKRNKDEKLEPQNHPVVKFLSRHFKVYPRYVGKRFFIRKSGILYFTPLFIVLLFIEFTDLIFATDSIPAIFSITRDPYIVFFSNIFAILGLRSMFFLLVHAVNLFHFLKIGISLLLVYVGAKLLLHSWLEKIDFKSIYSLYIILTILLGSIALSLIFRKEETEKI
jgi:tellurite resistance protein TerC